jgi:hypothetical protein
MNAKARESARKALLRLQAAVHDLNQELSLPNAIEHAIQGWGAEDLVKAFMRFDRLRLAAAVRVNRCVEARPSNRRRS